MVEHWSTERDGPLSEQAMRARLEALGYKVNRYVYPPGTEFPTHTHGVDKIDAVLAGRFRVTLPEGEFVLGAGDFVRVPKGVAHSAATVGSEPVVSLDGVKH